MTFSTLSKISRRELLRRSAALSTVGGASGVFGLQMAAMGSAAAAGATDYKALVCIFMFGGNDAHNMLLATDTDTWGRYTKARQQGAEPIALMPVGTAATAQGALNPVTSRTLPNNNTAFIMPEAWGGVLPITTATANPVPAGTNASARTFALHPYLNAALPLWTAGRMAAITNVGPLIQPTTKAQYTARSVPLPKNLMSHNDQQSTWQSGAGEGAQRGWGGLIADQILASNGTNGVFTALSTAGNAVFLAGQNIIQYQLSTAAAPAIAISAAATPTASLFGAANAGARVKAIITDNANASLFMKDYGAKVTRSMDAATTLNTTFANAAVTSVAAPTQLFNPITRANETNSLAVQLQTVARMIAAQSLLGVGRQVFFVSIGGFDNHDFQNTFQPQLLARLGHALAYFDGALANINGADRRAQVTTFTASDFCRTFTTNGDGTDHAWGSHHFVVGGAVKGGDVYGQYPTLGVDSSTFNNPSMAGNVLVPTTSVDQYAGTMASWFGLSNTQIDAIFPNLKNFSTRNLGFV